MTTRMEDVPTELVVDFDVQELHLVFTPEGARSES